MELWIWYTFGAIIFTVLVVLIDYIFMKSFFKNAESPTIISWVALWLVPIYVLLFHGFDISNIVVLIVSFILGLSSLAGIYLYFKSMFMGITPWTIWWILKLQMVLAFIVGVWFLKESLTFQQLLGHAIIFLWAAYLVSKDLKLKGDIYTYILPFGAMIWFSASFIWTDYLFLEHDFWSIFWMHTFWTFCWAVWILLFTKWWKKFQKLFSADKKKYILIAITAETAWLLMATFDALAYSVWPLSKVTFLRETYLVYLIIIALLLRSYFPKYIPDEWWDSKYEKLFIVIFMMVWVYLTIK